LTFYVKKIVAGCAVGKIKADFLKGLNCKYILNYENTLTAKNAKKYTQRAQKNFFCGFCAIPRRHQRLLDNKFNLFSEEASMLTA